MKKHLHHFHFHTNQFGPFEVCCGCGLIKKKQLQEGLRIAIQSKDSAAEENIRQALDEIGEAKEEAEIQKDDALTALEAGKETLLDDLASIYLVFYR